MRMLILGMLILGMLTAAALLSSRPALAYEGPWCAVVDQGGGVVEELCSMQSFEMCRAEARRWGSTGFCRQNSRFPGYWTPPGEPPRKRSNRKYSQ